MKLAVMGIGPGEIEPRDTLSPKKEEDFISRPIRPVIIRIMKSITIFLQIGPVAKTEFFGIIVDN
jgi:hypothetical protein